MTLLRVWRARLKALLAGRRIEAEIDQELSLHLQLLIDEYERSGMSRAEAERAARLRFGNPTILKESCREARALWTWFERLIQDLHYGFRTLRKSPGFVAVAVLSLAVGIGANTTIFTMVNALLLKPIGVNDLPRLVSIFTADERNPDFTFGTSRDNYLDLRDRNSVFDEVTAIGSVSVNLASGAGEPESVVAELVTGNYFSTLGTPPLIGRGFRPDEDQVPGANLVTVLGHSVWQTRFGGDPSIVGRNILVNNQPFLVVGVMPNGFRGTDPITGPMLWVPYMTYPVTTTGQYHDGLTSRRFTAFEVTGRLKPGVTRGQAEADLKTIARQLALEYPNENGGRTVVLRSVGIPFEPQQTRAVTISVALLTVIVGLVLFVACINVANLLLARMTVRRREIAIRQSIGATRARLMRQFLTEGVLLSALGTVIGLLITKVSVQILWAFRPPFLDAGALDLKLDVRVLVFTIALSLITCLLFALAPAIKGAQTQATELKGRGLGGDVGTSNLRHILITVQITFSLIALVGAALFLRSLQQAGRIDPGFAVDEVAMMNVDLAAQGYNEAGGRLFQQDVLERVSRIRGVDGVALADIVPLSGRGNTRSVYLEGEDAGDARNGYVIRTGIVSSGYFQLLGIALTRGRAFDGTDQPKTKPVAIVNEAMVRRFWGGQDPIGKRVRFIRTGYFEIVGVVKDAAYDSLGGPARPILYRPLSQVYQADVSILVRSHRPDEALSNARQQLRQLDQRLPITNVMSMGDVLRQSLWATRLGASLMTVLGFMSLLLAVIGIYGVMAYSVTQRTPEISLRLALGAGRSNVFRLVLGKSLRLALVGVAIGVVISLGTSHFISSLLYGSATDLVSFLAASIIVIAAAIAASYLPARRAIRIDPVIALRAE